MPFRIGPMISATIITVAVSAAIIGLVRLADELHAGGKAQCEAIHAEAQTAAATQAGQQATEAAAAREAAFKEGAFGRLRAQWCTNCEEAR